MSTEKFLFIFSFTHVSHYTLTHFAFFLFRMVRCMFLSSLFFGACTKQPSFVRDDVVLCNVELITFHECLLSDYFGAVRFRQFYSYFLIEMGTWCNGANFCFVL